MMVSKSKVEKLEEAMFGKLSPKDRAYWALKETAAGNKEQADRIALACPRVKYTSADLDFTNRMDELLDLAETGAFLLLLHRQVCQMVERQIADLAPTLAKLMVIRVPDRMWPLDDSEEPDAIQARNLEENFRQVVTDTTARALTLWRGGLIWRFRAEWAGFEALCQEEAGMDARTLILASEEKLACPPSGLLAWLDTALTEDISEHDDSDGRMREIREETLAAGRSALARRRGLVGPEAAADGPKDRGDSSEEAPA